MNRAETVKRQNRIFKDKILMVLGIEPGINGCVGLLSCNV
jgi:hypothetical protein